MPKLVDFPRLATSLPAAPSTAHREAYAPLDIGRSFHNGHLFYVCDTVVLSTDVDAEGRRRTLERREPLIIRSDGQQLSVIESPAPRGTPQAQRILRLSDGTPVEEFPVAPANQSWRWPAIQRYLEAKRQGHPAKTRGLGAIIVEIEAILKSRVWLPSREDYTVLALTAVATYAQPIFEAVPFILLRGEPASGKSTIGDVICRLSANATIAGQVSAAAAARLIHETRGLVVLDDLEAIARRQGRDSTFSELAQWLKVSYAKATADKVLVNVRGMRARPLHGFGIKVISNTGGTDSILGSRMIHVLTRRMPPAVLAARQSLAQVPDQRLAEIRDELHTWVFEHATEIDEVYRRLTPSAQDRAEQIAAPLRTFAQMAGDRRIIAQLEIALRRAQAAPTRAFSSPTDAVKEGALSLARQGFHAISSTGLILEMRRLADKGPGDPSAAWEQPDLVGRLLRLQAIVKPSHGFRLRRYGRNLRFRPFTDGFLKNAQVGEQTPPSRDPWDFCLGCSDCPYLAHGCELAKGRMAGDEPAAAKGNSGPRNTLTPRRLP